GALSPSPSLLEHTPKNGSSWLGCGRCRCECRRGLRRLWLCHDRVNGLWRAVARYVVVHHRRLQLREARLGGAEPVAHVLKLLVLLPRLRRDETDCLLLPAIVDAEIQVLIPELGDNCCAFV